MTKTQLNNNIHLHQSSLTHISAIKSNILLQIAKNVREKTNTRSPSRRQVLRAAGCTGIVALAGCVGKSASANQIILHNHKSEKNMAADSKEHTEENRQGKSKSQEDSHQLPDPVDQITVAMVSSKEGFHFEPHIARLKLGGTVTWKCKSGSHSSTAYDPRSSDEQRIPGPAPSWDSGVLQPDETYSHTFNYGGIYDYFCEPHESKGMVGRVLVGDSLSQGVPGLQPPQDSLPKAAQKQIRELNSKTTISQE